MKSASESQLPRAILSQLYISHDAAADTHTKAKHRGSLASVRSICSGAAQHEHFHGQEMQGNTKAEHRNGARKSCRTSPGFVRPKWVLYSITLLLLGPLERVALLEPSQVPPVVCSAGAKKP